MSAEKTCYTFHHVGGQEVAVETKSDNPVKKVVRSIESWKVILGVIASMIAMVIAGTIYVQSFATTEAVATSMDRHEASEGHPSLAAAVRAISDQLIEFRITLAASVKYQEKMDRKLDQILSVIPLVRLPTYQPAQPTQPDP